MVIKVRNRLEGYSVNEMVKWVICIKRLFEEEAEIKNPHLIKQGF